MMPLKSILRLYLRRVAMVLFLVKLVTFPFLTIYALVLLILGRVEPHDLWLFSVMLSLLIVGVTAGYHRMETHKSFKAHPIVRFLLLVFGSMASQGPVTYWVAAHLKHHALFDKSGDPHSPLHGFFHAHYTWIFKFDWNAAYAQYKNHFEGDKMLLFFEHTYLLWSLSGAFITYFIGGWSGVLWGYVVAVFMQNQFTYLVNSWAHMFGSRDYDTDDDSRNSFLVGLLAFGEGWHNNHHAFPKSAYHGLKWYQIDFTGYLITMLESLRLVRDVYRVPKHRLGKTPLKNTEEVMES